MKKSVTALCALAISLITTGSFAGDGTPAQWQPGANKSLVPMKKSLTNMPGPGPVSERVMVKPGGTVAERPGGPGPVSERGMLKPGGLVAERPGGPGHVAERPGGPGPVSEKVVGSKAAQQLQVGGEQRQIMQRVGPGPVA